MMNFNCPKCNKGYKIKSDFENKKVKCRECNFVFFAPPKNGKTNSGHQLESAEHVGKDNSPEKKTNDKNDSKQCPFCAEVVKSAAIKCKHCGEKLDSLPKQAISKELQGKQTFCPSCGTAASCNLRKCGNCGSQIRRFDLFSLIWDGNCGLISANHRKWIVLAIGFLTITFLICGLINYLGWEKADERRFAFYKENMSILLSDPSVINSDGQEIVDTGKGVKKLTAQVEYRLLERKEQAYLESWGFSFLVAFLIPFLGAPFCFQTFFSHHPLVVASARILAVSGLITGILIITGSLSYWSNAGFDPLGSKIDGYLASYCCGPALVVISLLELFSRHQEHA